MKAHPEVYLVCAAAIAIGVVLGPIVSAKPAHSALPIVVEKAALPDPLPSRGGAASTTAFAAQAEPAPRADAPLSGARVVADQTPGVSAPEEERRLDRSAILQLSGRCAPSEPAAVLASIVRVESAYRPLKIGVNGHRRRVFEPASRQAAAVLAARLIASGENVDLGLAQINSRNLGWLGLSVEAAFDPCRNLAAAAEVMARGYKTALRVSPSDRSLLQTAYSLYNTGDVNRGLANGYVDRVEGRR